MEGLSDYEKGRNTNMGILEAVRKEMFPDDLIPARPMKFNPKGKFHRKRPQLLKRRKTRKQSNYEPRRSVRIQEMTLKTKRVKGFKGFREIKHETEKVNEEGTKTIEVTYDYICDDVDESDDDWDKYDKVEFYDVSTESDSAVSSSNEDEEPARKRRKTSHREINVLYLPPEQVTDIMLQGIAWHSAGKNYNTQNGSTCHQCRQKTMDTKTVCRSGTCAGMRGQFCGFCLLNRYGEKADVALKDPTWTCPPCKGLCNCSICRNRQGKAPTGILAPFVRERGYNCVSDYLKDNEKNNVKEVTATPIKEWKMKIVGVREKQ